MPKDRSEIVALLYEFAVGECFEQVEDPRVERTRQHDLIDIILIALCASLANADDWVSVEFFAKEKEAWFRKFLSLPNGIPSHDTFGRVFSRIKPEQFERAFADWVSLIRERFPGEVVAFDGKTARGSHNRGIGQTALHMVSAFASQSGLVLGQRAVGDSNEITAMPELLALLDVRGCIVTTDSMCTQKSIAAQILSQGAAYALALKENHPTLHEDVVTLFAEMPLQAVQHDAGHGRVESRRSAVVSDPTVLAYLNPHGEWPGLAAVGVVERDADTLTSVERRYFLLSHPFTPDELIRIVRSHWHIENKLHWVLDVAFDEDRSRIRKDHAQRNLALLRKMALNLIRLNNDKGSLRIRRFKACLNEAFFLKLLGLPAD